MDQAITKLGKNGFDGVYAANDGTAGGAIAAMKAAGIDPSTRPDHGPGRRARRHPADPRRRAVHDGLQGHQAAGRGRRDRRPWTSSRASRARASRPTPVNNGTEDVPCIIYDPVAVTKDNVKDTIVADGYWTAAEICTGPYKAACTAAGIQ